MRRIASIERRSVNKGLVSPRSRQYYEGYKGPYRAFVRKIEKDFKFFQLNKELRKNYNSIVDVYLSNKNKISVRFS